MWLLDFRAGASLGEGMHGWCWDRVGDGRTSSGNPGQPTALDLSLRVRGIHPVILHYLQQAPITHGQKRDSEASRGL